MCVSLVFFFKQKTAYEMRISDWSSDVCSSDLRQRNTVPVATMAHDTSPSIGEVHQAAVLVPPALPSERHESVGPLTNTWPSRLVPVGLPTISTKASRAACAGARSEERREGKEGVSKFRSLG